MRAVLTGLGCGALDLGIYDRLFELRGPRPRTAPILIVTIDESSFADLGTQWPFPRAMHGELLDRISRGRPLVIGIDLIFDTPSSRGPRDDEALGAAVARAGNVVLSAAVGHVISEREPDGHMRRGLTALQVGAQTLVAFGTAVHRIARGAGLPAAPVPRDRSGPKHSGARSS